MWAAIRLTRALRVFAVIFLSYLWQMSWARLWKKRYDTKERWRKINRRNARRMYKGFVRLRGVYIKLGQILSVMGTFLPREYTEELEGLQDDVPPASYKQIKATFVKSFSKQPHEVFTTFNQEPIAAASLGQVHEATNAAGDKLAVKILYPNVATIIKVDLRVLGWALALYKNFVPIQQIGRVHEQLGDMLARETDLANEARCITRMAKNFDGDADVVLPKVYPEWSSPTVMTMTFMDGVKISKKDALATLGLDPYDVATKLVKVFYKQLFIDKFFHADPHPGNFFVQRGPNGQVRIVVLDLGSATPLTDNLADGMFDILSGLMTRKDDLVIQGIDRMGFISPNGDRALLERTVRKYFEKLLNINISDFSKIDPGVAEQLADPDMKRDELRELMKAIAYPEGWFYVERAAVIMFGLSSTLAPKLNGIHVGFPYITQFMMEKNAKRLSDAAAAKQRAESSAGSDNDGGGTVSEKAEKPKSADEQLLN
ncbi:MAG TPA: AarF/UbiB family protein [Kofleriaceae bacterium]|nr:AarF/UbiB family protein [Kofleriaceae bacterium]